MTLFQEPEFMQSISVTDSGTIDTDMSLCLCDKQSNHFVGKHGLQDFARITIKFRIYRINSKKFRIYFLFKFLRALKPKTI